MITNRKARLSIVIALMMALSVFCIVMVQPVSAKSKVYSSTSAYIEPPSKDKDGSYYIWAITEQGDLPELLCAKSASGKVHLLDMKTTGKPAIANTIVTNGDTAFYAIVDNSKKTTFYKVTFSKKKPSKIKTVSGACELAAYHKGKLYYVNSQSKKLYWCDPSKKTTKLVKKNFKQESPVINSYGKYMIRSESGADMNGHQYLYNLDTKKQKKLPNAVEARVYGDKVYYYRFEKQSAAVHQCNLSGKNSKKIKNIGYATDLYLGKKAVWFKDKNGRLKKLTYKTGKVTKVK